MCHIDIFSGNYGQQYSGNPGLGYSGYPMGLLPHYSGRGCSLYGFPAGGATVMLVMTPWTSW